MSGSDWANQTSELCESSNGTLSGGERVFSPSRGPSVGWCEGTRLWGFYWTIFCHFMTALHGVLLLWAVVNIICILRNKTLHSRWYFVTLNAMVLIFALTRLLVFAIDPYNTDGHFNILGLDFVASILLNLSFPSLTVAFYVLFAALHKTINENAQIIPAYLFDARALLFISLFNFSISLSTDLLLAFTHGAHVMMLVCQAVYILWGVLFFLLYLYLFCQLYGKLIRADARHKKKTCYLRGGTCGVGSSGNSESSSRRAGMPLTLKITLLAAGFFLASSLLNLYAVAGELGSDKMGVRSLRAMSVMQGKLWPFFIYHVLFVVCELLMAVTIAIVGTQPLQRLRAEMLSLSTRPITSSDDTFSCV